MPQHFLSSPLKSDTIFLALREDTAIFNSIRKFLGSQNFALINTDYPDTCILQNQVNGQGIFCVLADNTGSHIADGYELAAISAGLCREPIGARPSNILFIVITSDTDRDKSLASIGLNLWLADVDSRSLFIYENQNSDFYGLRYGIESAMAGEFSDGMFEFKMNERKTAANPYASSNTVKKHTNIPYVTIILAAVNVLYYLILAATGSTSSTSHMVSMGACYGPFVFQRFEIWRLISAMFVHFSLSHLISNMVYLGIAGYNLERVTGHFKFFLIYILSGIGGNLVSAAFYYITGANTVSGGASGAIYGLIGGIAVLTFYSFRRLKPANLFLRIIILLIFVFYSSFATVGVDGAAHIGGFFFGILLTFLFTFGGKKHAKR